MSLGYVGHARLEAEDTEIAIYSYTGENWNVQDEAIRKRLESAIGQITIDKSCLIEPELPPSGVFCQMSPASPQGRLGSPSKQSDW